MRFLINPGVIFGLIFSVGGFMILSETAIPTWQSWYQMRDWEPGYAELLSVSGAENYTEAGYRYHYNGTRYLGNRAYVAEFRDNIGSYHADLLAQLLRYQQADQALPIWVNPQSPRESVIDRDMRWGLFILMTAFCSVFIFIGLGVVYASTRHSKKRTRHRMPSLNELRKIWQAAQKDPNFKDSFLEFRQHQSAEILEKNDTELKNTDWQSRKGWESARIGSGAKKGVWFFWGFAIFWNAITISAIVPVIPRELATGNYAALLVLLFPLVGLFLLYKAIHSTLEYRHFGPVLFEMDPFPGAIGGHVGGRIQVKNLNYRRAVEASEIWIRLECVYSYESGTGKNRSRKESIKWAEQGKPKIENLGHGCSLAFRFDVPEKLPNADIERKSSYHFWRLTAKADITGIDLNRNYDIPVFDTGATSRFVSYDISAQSAKMKARESEQAKLDITSGNFDIEGLSRAMRLTTQGNQVHLKFSMFRNKFLSLFSSIFAGGFGFASYSMIGAATEGGLLGIATALFSIPFLLVALVASLATIYLSFNNLHVAINSSGATVLRRLLFLPIYRRSLHRNEISHLSIKRSGSTGQGVDKIEHFKLKAHDKNGGTLTLAEDLDGEDVSGHFRDYIAQRLNVAVR